ncbi:MAG: hypothetical protein KDH09_03785 [Chrysiogenetes bacterium]|nr:hypothetical protein [Chrysiogenetes bacterium]
MILTAWLCSLVAVVGTPVARAEDLGAGRPAIPREMEQLLKTRIDSLFPEEPREKLPETSGWQRAEAVLGTLGYTPFKALTACTYTTSSFFHHAAFEGDEGLRILKEGWGGDWLLVGEHLSGAEPLDLIGPDRKFPGHNPLARETFIESWYLLYSNVDYQGVPKGVETPEAGQTSPEVPDAIDKDAPASRP